MQNKTLYFKSIDYNSNVQLIQLPFEPFEKNMQIHVNLGPSHHCESYPHYT